MRSTTLVSLGAAAATSVAAVPSYVMYFDQWHKDQLPDKATAAGITHAITAFATDTEFNSGSSYTPFMPLDQVRALFDEGTKLCLAIGGWGDTSGFGTGSATEESRKTYAKNVADTLDRLGYDCVDIDWEYPGGNGEDYKQTPNDQKVQEIDNYPLFLKEIKSAIGDKELSIAVPGKIGDMIAYTEEKVPEIDGIVDRINVMTYDLMNRRDNTTNHHSGVKNSLETVQTYIDRGMTPSKMTLGFAFYAKFFNTAQGADCSDKPVGCEAAQNELPDGTDPGTSGAITFEASSYSGNADFTAALENGKTDEENGGQWYWDSAKGVFWTWDTPELIARKFDEIINAKGLGGAMGWSLAQDSHDWSHMKAVQTGVKNMS